MMKNSKKWITLLFALYFALVLSACSGNSAEYESPSSFEYHFYPEEYEEEYSEITRAIPLEHDKDYKFLIKSECKSGTITIILTYDGNTESKYIITAESPCEEQIELLEGTTDETTFTINIDPDTEGFVIVEQLIK